MASVVHWAADAEEHNQIVYSIFKQHGIDKMVKSKSMLTEECDLNHYLQEHGIEVIDTDLGERIVQMRKEAAKPYCAACHSSKKRRRKRYVSRAFGQPKKAIMIPTF